MGTITLLVSSDPKTSFSANIQARNFVENFIKDNTSAKDAIKENESKIKAELKGIEDEDKFFDALKKCTKVRDQQSSKRFLLKTNSGTLFNGFLPVTEDSNNRTLIFE